MEKRTIKTEINDVISDLPEAALNDVLIYVLEIQKRIYEKEKIDSTVDKIFEEDRNLLDKLAK